MAKSLSQLVQQTFASDPAIAGVTADSRKVKPGFLFAALPGSAIHGGEFIQYALRQGAVAILTDAAGAAVAGGGLFGAQGLDGRFAALFGLAVFWAAAVAAHRPR